MIGKAPVGVLDHDLRQAALRALCIPRTLCREFALRFSWRRSAEEFAANLMPIPGTGPRRQLRRRASAAVARQSHHLLYNGSRFRG